ncbi:MAG: type II toxin-antitoxin system RelE/ParE family toxin [Helicobacter sp.]|uniref:type II toxin-antitoxin system RelE family toxin n=1 Tax=Helicobacter sp. TaxID=218 RepID=UPI0025BBE485|nr:type II toxin-antitoxin system RelE/ParE family toxin [Helicobacter sp.]MCH5312860.1 type II toxin-antitoxin system RelE/ParE family toxin [Helicobacter sp.]
MSFNVTLENKCDKFLKKLAKSDHKSYKLIILFLEKLETCENPCTLPNAKHLQGFNDNRYRWRIGEYRIIGIVENGKTKIIKVIKIDKRDSTTYKGL